MEYFNLTEKPYFNNMSTIQYALGTYNDVIDRDVYEFHKEPNESHDAEPDRSSYCYLLELWNIT